jgi:diguanylate cyclase (GGDEF)-like protein
VWVTRVLSYGSDMAETAAFSAAPPERLLAQAWASALTAEDEDPRTAAETRQVLTRLSATLLGVLRESPFRPGQAVAIGGDLAAAALPGTPGRSGQEVLGRSLRVLTAQLPGLLAETDAAAERIGAAVEELANGYVGALQRDPLTGLPNRSVFFSRLGAALDDGAGLLYLDLDGFKTVNDTLGHDAGDQLLTAVAERIGTVATAHGALAARIGGDEFVVLAGPSASGLIALATEILDEVRLPILTGAGQISVTACAGIAHHPAKAWPAAVTRSSVAAAAEAASIVADADAALYQAKSAGPGTWAVHDPEGAARQTGSVATSIRAGLERGEFRMRYSPIAGLADGQVVGAEAVPRWNHPAFGKLAAEVFVPLAEASEAAPELSGWLITSACRDAAAWQAASQGTYVSVRMPAGELLRPGLAAEVARMLAAAGLPAALLRLEFDESALAVARGQALEEMARLAELGVGVAVSGFGTASAGFRYLRTLPPGGVILDEELTGDPDDAVVAALTGLAHARGLSVTARAVTSEAQASLLGELGCDTAQGEFFSAPVPASRIPMMLRTAAAALPHRAGRRVWPAPIRPG